MPFDKIKIRVTMTDEPTVTISEIQYPHWRPNSAELDAVTPPKDALLVEDALENARM